MSRIFGDNAIGDLVQGCPEAIATLLVTPRAQRSHGALIAQAEAAGIRIKLVVADALKERAGSRGGSALAADVRIAQPLSLEAINTDGGANPIVVVLDQVSDPHNLGAIMRSANAFGACAVITTRDRAAPLNDAALRSSAGAAAHIPLTRVTNLSRALRQLHEQGLWAVALAGEASQDLYDVDLTLGIALVFGAEGPGIRTGVRKQCQLTARLPMFGAVRSLNVSVTAGVALAEVTRQRRKS